MTIYSAASGMVLEQHRQELLARNLAGSTVAGYKKEYITSHNFKADLEQERMQNTGAFQGTSGGKEEVFYGQGALHTTNHPLDFAIHGEGFFEVQTQDGQNLMTRNGAFMISNDGTLMTRDGNTVLSTAGNAITIPIDQSVNNIEVSSSGLIRVNEGGEEIQVELGNLRIVDIPDKNLLKKISSSYFRVEPGSENQIAEVDTLNPNFSVMNGHLEDANTNPIQEMTMMIQSTRDFEMGQKMLKMLDDIGKQVRTKLG